MERGLSLTFNQLGDPVHRRRPFAGIEQSLNRMWTEQGDKLSTQFGYDPKVMEYLGKVAEAASKG